MSRKKNTVNPFAFGLFAWQAGMVFAIRGARLMVDPAAVGTLAEMAVEKQVAFAKGAAHAMQTGMRGGSMAAMANAGLAPSRRRVKSNFKALGKTTPRRR